MNSPASASHKSEPTPIGSPRNLFKYGRYDLLSGFLVFLIALPLCLAISLASGYPAMAGVMTAIVGGFIGATISNSELTIKGPAAGLIVIVLGCVIDFGGGLEATPEAKRHAYQAALAVSVVAALIQVSMAVLRAGILSEFVPLAAVHGMLSAIGLIIMIKQFPNVVGYDDPAHKLPSEPLAVLLELPRILWRMNPAIAAIGITGLVIMFGKPLLPFKWLKAVPGQLLVMLAGIGMAVAFQIAEPHSYTLGDQSYQLSNKFLVSVPDNVLQAITYPDFSVLNTVKAWKWVALFAIIGSLETLLSAKAVDLLDPWKRKSDLNRDLLAVGCGNLVAALIGGLPMISEIVRSRANIDNGARTRFANLYHAMFLLAAVALFPAGLRMIPLSALAAMLIYTGFRLAHPNEFLHVYRVGIEQLAIFLVTIIGVLAIDLLAGVAMGIGLKFLIVLYNGAPLRSLFNAPVDTIEEESSKRLLVHDSAVFCNWMSVRRALLHAIEVEHKNVTVDFHATAFVDHTVMERLHELSKDAERAGIRVDIVGLDMHVPASKHPQAARTRRRMHKPSSLAQSV